MISSRVLTLLSLSGVLLAYTPARAGIRPEIRRAFDLVDRSGGKSIYRANVQVRNEDSLFLSSLIIPYDQGSWEFSDPEEDTWGVTLMEINLSARAGTGAWRESVCQESWFEPLIRKWVAECELGGIEHGGVIDLVFFAAVDESVDILNRPIRLGYASCGREPVISRIDYWSGSGGILLRRVTDLDTLQIYRYTGYGDRLVLSQLSGAKSCAVPEGWEVSYQDETRVEIVSVDGCRPAEFAIEFEHGPGPTDLISWADDSDGISCGFAFGPGTAQYPILDTVVYAAEPGWGVLIQGLSIVLVLLVAATVAVHRRRRKRRR